MAQTTSYDNAELYYCTVPPTGLSGMHVRVCEDADGFLTKSVVQLYSPASRADALADGLNEVLLHHRCPDEIRRLGLAQITAYLCEETPYGEEEQVCVAKCKQLLVAPMARYLRNDPPKSPYDFRPTGAFKRWLKPRLNAFNRRNTHLWYSWFQAKRSTDPASEELIEQCYREHCESLTQPDVGDGPTIERLMSNPVFSDLLDGLSRQLAGISVDDVTGFSASHNASFESTRKCGGAARTLHDDYMEFLQIGDLRSDYDTAVDEITRHRKLAGSRFLVEDSDVKFLYRRECFQSMSWRPVVVRGRRMLYNVTQSHYSTCDLRWWKEWLRVSVWRIIFEDDTRFGAKIQGVCEPLKVRVISKGPSVAYHVARCFQRRLHDLLRELPPFRLIGRTLSPSDLIDLKPPQIGCAESLEWFSVDYKAATDKLSWRYSSRILDQLLCHVQPALAEVIWKALAPHDLYYPRPCGGYPDSPDATQATGQLMGSIVSFPILCLANYGVFLDIADQMPPPPPCISRIRIFERRNGELVKNGGLERPVGGVWKRGAGSRYHRNRVLVNGDDMLYCAPRRLWSRHCEVAAKVGLEMSVGKAYHHPEYANINSTSFHSRIADAFDVTQVNYYNVGLLLNKHKVQRVTETAAAHVVGSELTSAQCCNIVVDGALPGRQRDALDRYLTFNNHALSREAQTGCSIQRCYYLPASSGGLGIVAPLGWKIRITREQRRLAFSARPMSVRPLPGYECTSTTSDWIQSPWESPHVPPKENMRPQSISEQPCLSRRDVLAPRVRHEALRWCEWL